MTYAMLPAVMAQMTDVLVFVLVAVLGVCDGVNRAALCDTLRAAADLVACAVVRRQANAAAALIEVRAHAVVVPARNC